ncbi:protein of unknown function DUF847 [Dethiosulfovibrio peptidovorans DSM 11002]|uniref:Uncharacterized protein n=1 Tax=Dethiosulfovibrio peptidovorans DSM 11002 TaxID=469381 RepID=D2Z5A2_9BACT|nr:glycosyl hydrolase 108 family protein [Dethiosulfovibrio peptidovorans]EFC92474.1 protein of unknown function DUF847 [Dethiosulfovibrio peptidovorans DSM 11002]
MTDRFSEVLSVVLGFEGGYVNDPDDRGGRTNYGITEGTLRSAYERKIVSHKDIRSLSKADAALIYWSDYWEPIEADGMPNPLDLVMFDCAVNHGVGGAGRLLQKTLNFVADADLSVDGVIGPNTLKTLKKALDGNSPEALSMSVLAMRTRFYVKIVEGDSSQRKFLWGWVRRRVAGLIDEIK